MSELAQPRAANASDSVPRHAHTTQTLNTAATRCGARSVGLRLRRCALRCARGCNLLASTEACMLSVYVRARAPLLIFTMRQAVNICPVNNPFCVLCAHVS